MEQLPVEVVGNILSLISAPRDVVLASATCRKWREAFQNHLSVLAFIPPHRPGFDDPPTSQVETLITRTLFQTKGLQSLTIVGDDLNVMSASVVKNWLLYTRDSLRELHYDVRTDRSVNVIDVCGRERLEKLTLSHYVIEGVDPNYHRLTSLRSLSLRTVRLSLLDLSLFLAGCPKLESLELFQLHLHGPLLKLELRAPNLRKFYVEGIGLDEAELILESDRIESLCVVGCDIYCFKVIEKGSLKNIRFHAVAMQRLEMCDSIENLETIELRCIMINHLDFYRLISKCSKLRSLKIWDLGSDDLHNLVGLDNIAMFCPQLSLLDLGCFFDGDGDGQLPCCLKGSTRFENVVCLEVGWSGTLKDEFIDLVEYLLERCPSLRKLAIEGVISHVKDWDQPQVFSRFMNSFVRITKKYIDLNVEFNFREPLSCFFSVSTG